MDASIRRQAMRERDAGCDELESNRLEINTLAGRDSVDSSGLAVGAIQLFVDGVPVP